MTHSKIVLVGLAKNQVQALPQNIIGITRTSSANELAELYSNANVYVNTSVEETMGLTTVEAMPCGTPVVVHNVTNGQENLTSRRGSVNILSFIKNLLTKAILERKVDKHIAILRKKFVQAI